MISVFLLMPRYKIAVTIGAELYDDHKGVDLACPDTARREAQQIAWKLWQDPPFGSQGPVIVRVIDGAGRVIHAVTFPEPQSRH